MSELRWHPLLEQWVVVASHRQDRPQLPTKGCPFCIGSGRVPDNYDVLIYPNDFPAFSADSEPFHPEPGLFKTTGSQGACDVVLYSPDHNLRPSQLPVEQWRKVVDLWTARSRELTTLPYVEYVMVFENSGEAVGVTMPHPHGQIYAFPFTPPLYDKELTAASGYMDANQSCIYCELLRRELADGIRVVAQNDSFAAFVPFAARFPGEIAIYARRHFQRLTDMQSNEPQDLASLISVVRKKYDSLYGILLPLMMILHQGPAKGDAPYSHFHIDLLPLQRSATKLKFLAAVESGAGAFLADTRAEERARQLREAEPRTPLVP